MPIKDVQVTNKQHAVPQNIMDVEFKIIGELTLRQFAYIIVFGGIAYISAVYMRGIFRWPVTVICALLGFGLAFVPLQERGLDQWIVNFFLAVYTPNQKIWRKDVIAPAVFLYQNMAVVKQELITLAPTSSRRKLEDFLEHAEAEQKEDRLDIPENKYIQMAKDAFAGSIPTKAKASAKVSTTFAPPAAPIAPPIPAPAPAPVPPPVAVPPVPAQPVNKPEPVVKPQPMPVKIEEKKEEKPEPVKPPEPPKPFIEPVKTPEPAKPAAPPPQQPVPPQPVEPAKPVEPKPEPKLEPQPAEPLIIKSKIAEQPNLKLPGKRESELVLAPFTPDRHSGRKFTSLLPKQGELILPIRGERRLKTSDEVNIDQDIQQKTDQLNKLISQIKGSGSFKKPPEPPKTEAPQTPPQPTHYEAKLESKGDVKPKVQTPPSHPVPAPTSAHASHTITIPESKQPSSKADSSMLQSEIKSLKQELELSQREKERMHSATAPTTEKPGEKPTYINMAPLTNKPNVVSGVVLNTLGVGLQNVIVIVRNDRNETVRAVKTNSLGLFTFITPLADGSYKVIVDEFHKSGAFFDIISLQAKGDVIPPIEFRGR